MKTDTTTTTRPPSASFFAINALALSLFYITILGLHYFLPTLSGWILTTAGLLATAIPLALHELIKEKVHLRPSTGLNATEQPLDRGRLITKLIGLYATWLIILLLYQFNPAYHHSANTIPFFQGSFNFVMLLLPLAFLLSPLYVQSIDRRQTDPYDEYWHMGCLVLGRWREVRAAPLKLHLTGWFIKGFFLPIMFAALNVYVDKLLDPPLMTPTTSFADWHEYGLNFLYSLDVVFGVLGYLLTLRWLDSHIRSTDPSFAGWIVCLICYSPLSFLGFNLVEEDDDAYSWNHWLALFPSAYYIIGTVTLLLVLVYALATIAFGYRISNLTYRGVITSGPYRYCRHPAYLCKILSWWLLTLPFLSAEGSWVAARNTLYLMLISGIYYLRAKTEERHLLQFPEYAAYSNWVKNQGLFSWARKKAPTP